MIMSAGHLAPEAPVYATHALPHCTPISNQDLQLTDLFLKDTHHALLMQMQHQLTELSKLIKFTSKPKLVLSCPDTQKTMI